MKATGSEKRQVAIPKALRDRLSIRPGQELDFSEEQGSLVARKVVADDGIANAFGMLDLEMPTDELMPELRGPGLDRSSQGTLASSFGGGGS